MADTKRHSADAAAAIVVSDPPRVIIEAVAGFTAGLLNTLVVHPLDVIKTRLQGIDCFCLSCQPTRGFFFFFFFSFFAGLTVVVVFCPNRQVNRTTTTPIPLGASLAIIRDIATNEAVQESGSAKIRKLRAFYRGLTPNITGNTVGWALYFMWYVIHILCKDMIFFFFSAMAGCITDI